MVFWFEELFDVWAAMVLKTPTSKPTDFRKDSIHIPIPTPPVDAPVSVKQSIGEETHEQWMDLNHILVRLWESSGVHTHILYTTEEEKREACKYIGALLPGMTKKGIVEMVDDDILF